MGHTLPKAPVAASAEIDIAADEREVWAVIADIAAWPTWNPALREAVFDDELEVGRRFRFTTAFGSTRGTLQVVDAPRILAWKGRLLSMGQHQVWRIEPAPGGCHVTTEAAMTGLGARLFAGRLRERLTGEVDALVQLLKLEAESRASEKTEAEEHQG